MPTGIYKHKPHSDVTKKNIGLSNSISGKGHKVLESTRKKISLSTKGDKSHRWKGGLTPINNTIRHSVEYRLWREAVFKRDNYTCVWCGYKGELNADHIKPFAYYPELRFAIDNGRTLCVPCHKTTDTYKSKQHNSGIR
jgi:hypothetical protein